MSADSNFAATITKVGRYRSHESMHAKTRDDTASLNTHVPHTQATPGDPSDAKKDASAAGKEGAQPPGDATAGPAHPPASTPGPSLTIQLAVLGFLVALIVCVGGVMWLVTKGKIIGYRMQDKELVEEGDSGGAESGGKHKHRHHRILVQVGVSGVSITC